MPAADVALASTLRIAVMRLARRLAELEPDELATLREAAAVL